jgi:uncharacterized protein (TIRG00374 family)
LSTDPESRSESPRQPASRTSLWHWAIAIPLAAVLVYLAFRGVNWRAVWTTISTVDPRYLGLGLLVSCASTFVRSLRWRVLLNAEGRIGVGTVFWANSAGYLGNNFLPARAGELIRSAMISSRSGLSNTYALTTALAERLMDAIALIVISSFVLATMREKPEWLAEASKPIAVVGFAGAIGLIVLPHTGNLLERLLARLPAPAKVRDRLIGIADQVLLGVRALHSFGRFSAFCSLTALIWTLDATGSIIVARALGLSLSFPVALLLLTGLGLGSALPSTPGYVGIFQFVAVTILVPFGFSRSDALAYILVVQAAGYLLVVLFGVIGILQYQRGGGKLRENQNREQ